ncbi:MAG: DUF1501 domain-containing protein [Bacteroidota bacterium]
MRAASQNAKTQISRREMLYRCRQGFGGLALLSMFGGLACGEDKHLPSGSPISDGSHHLPKAKSVIFLYMDGGISQVDSFDPKPRLYAERGENPYKKFKVDNTQFADIGSLMPSLWEFQQHGESGMWVSELFPHIATCVDDIAMVRSMVSNFPEHTNANYFLHTGIGIQGRPSMGAWVQYGLGSENENLPAYVVLDSGLIPPGGLDNFTSGFLPASYQASVFRTGDIPLANIQAQEASKQHQQQKLLAMQTLDRKIMQQSGGNDAIASAISNYELAANMQVSVPEVADLRGESLLTRNLYGMLDEDEHTRNYGAQCLLARRLVERGVRFIELTCPKVKADRWDQHSDLKNGHERNAHAVDQPIAGLLKDLKWRGLLDETLVVFAGEFGRTPFSQAGDGRDHNPSAFSIWMAGAGIKGGTVYGQTDEYGYRVVDKPTTIHDLHATMLHLLGIDHERLTYRFGGRDIRLTDVHGQVLQEILS